MAFDRDLLRPGGLQARGSALWDALTSNSESVERCVLAGEAARLADRLDRLDELLSGDIDTWVRLTHRLMTEDYVSWRHESGGTEPGQVQVGQSDPPLEDRGRPSAKTPRDLRKNNSWTTSAVTWRGGSGYLVGVPGWVDPRSPVVGLRGSGVGALVGL